MRLLPYVTLSRCPSRLSRRLLSGMALNMPHAIVFLGCEHIARHAFHTPHIHRMPCLSIALCAHTRLNKRSFSHQGYSCTCRKLYSIARAVYLFLRCSASPSLILIDVARTQGNRFLFARAVRQLNIELALPLPRTACHCEPRWSRNGHGNDC